MTLVVLVRAHGKLTFTGWLVILKSAFIDVFVRHSKLALALALALNVLTFERLSVWELLNDLPPRLILEPVSFNDLSVVVSELSFTFTSAIDEIASIDFSVSLPENAFTVWKSVHKIAFVLGAARRDKLAFALTTTLLEVALVQFAIDMLQLTITSWQSIYKVTIEDATIREGDDTSAFALSC